jgi:TP901 family phage tail tape measure protein
MAQEGALTAASLGVEFLAETADLRNFMLSGYDDLKRDFTAKGGIVVPFSINQQSMREEVAKVRAEVRRVVLTVPIRFGGVPTAVKNLRKDVREAWANQPEKLQLKIQFSHDGAALRRQIQNTLKESFKIDVIANVSQAGGGSSSPPPGVAASAWSAWQGNIRSQFGFTGMSASQMLDKYGGQPYSSLPPPLRSQLSQREWEELYPSSKNRPISQRQPKRVNERGQTVFAAYSQDRRAMEALMKTPITPGSAYSDTGFNPEGAFAAMSNREIQQLKILRRKMEQSAQRAAMAGPASPQGQQFMLFGDTPSGQQRMFDANLDTGIRQGTYKYVNDTAAQAFAQAKKQLAQNYKNRFMSGATQVELGGLFGQSPFDAGQGQQRSLFTSPYLDPKTLRIGQNQIATQNLPFTGFKGLPLGQNIVGEYTDIRRRVASSGRPGSPFGYNVVGPYSVIGGGGGGPAYPSSTVPVDNSGLKFTHFAGQALGTLNNKIFGPLNGFLQRFGDDWERAIQRKEGEARRHMFAGLSLSMAFTYPAIQYGRAALEEVTGFESSMAHTRALTGVGEQGTRIAAPQIIELSKELPQTARELADAYYFVASNGLKGSEAMKVLKASAVGAAGGLGETKDVADTTTSVLAAYRLEADKATSIVDALTAAVRVGKGEASQYAGAFAKVIPVAAQAGISFEEVAASMATMTRIGLSPSEAATAFRQMASNLFAPSKEAIKTMESLGTNPADLRNRMRTQGLAATLQQLMTASGGNIDILDKLVGNIRGLTGLLATAGNQASSYASNLDEIKKSAGDSAKANEAMAETVEYQWKRLLNAGKATLQQIGLKMLPQLRESVENVAEAMPGYMNEIIRVWEGLTPMGQNLLKAAGAFALLSGPILLNIALMRNLSAALMTVGATAGGAPLVALAALAVGVYALGEHFSATRTMSQGMNRSLQETSSGLDAMATPLGLVVTLFTSLAAFRMGAGLSIAIGALTSNVGGLLTNLTNVRTMFNSMRTWAGTSVALSAVMAGIGRPTGALGPTFTNQHPVVAGSAGGAIAANLASGIGPGFAAAAASAAALTVALGLGATAWQEYKSSADDAIITMHNFEIAGEGVNRNLDNITRMFDNNEGILALAENLRNQFSEAESSEELTRLAGSIRAKITQTKVRPDLDAASRDALLLQLDRMMADVDARLKAKLEVELAPGVISRVLGTIRAAIPTAEDRIGEYKGPTGNNIFSNLNDFPLSGPAFGQPGNVGNSPEAWQFNAFPVNQTRAIFNDSNATVYRAQQLREYIKSYKDLYQLESAFKQLGAATPRGQMLRSSYQAAGVGDISSLMLERLAVLRKDKAERDARRKLEPSAVSGRKEEVDDGMALVRAAQQERIRKQISMWQSYRSALDGVAGKIREYSNKTEEARVNNLLLQDSFAGLTAAARESALAIARVADRMRDLTEGKNVIQGIVGAMQRGLAELGITGNPLSPFIGGIGGMINYANNMRGMQREAQPILSAADNMARNRIMTLQAESDRIKADESNRRRRVRNQSDLPDAPGQMPPLDPSLLPRVPRGGNTNSANLRYSGGVTTKLPQRYNPYRDALAGIGNTNPNQFEGAEDQIGTMTDWLFPKVRRVLPLPGNENQMQVQVALQGTRDLERLTKAFRSLGYTGEVTAEKIDILAQRFMTMAQQADYFATSQRNIISNITATREANREQRLAGFEGDPMAAFYDEWIQAMGKRKPNLNLQLPEDQMLMMNYVKENESFTEREEGMRGALKANLASEIKKADEMRRNVEQDDAHVWEFLEQSLDNNELEIQAIRAEQEALRQFEASMLTKRRANESEEQFQERRNQIGAEAREGVMRPARFEAWGGMRQSMRDAQDALQLTRYEVELRENQANVEDEINDKLAARAVYQREYNRLIQAYPNDAEDKARQAEQREASRLRLLREERRRQERQDVQIQHDLQMDVFGRTRNILGAGVRPDSAEWKRILGVQQALQTGVGDRKISDTERSIRQAEAIIRFREQLETEQLRDYANELHSISDAMATMADTTGLAAKALQQFRQFDVDGADPVTLMRHQIEAATMQSRFELERDTEGDSLLTDTGRLRAINRRRRAAWAANPLLSQGLSELDANSDVTENATANREVREMGRERRETRRTEINELRQQLELEMAGTEVERERIRLKYAELELQRQLQEIGRDLTDEDRAALRVMDERKQKLLDLQEARNDFLEFANDVRGIFVNAFKNADGGVRSVIANMLKGIKDMFTNMLVENAADWMQGWIFGDKLPDKRNKGDNINDYWNGKRQRDAKDALDNGGEWDSGTFGILSDVTRNILQNTIGINGRPVIGNEEEIARTSAGDDGPGYEAALGAILGEGGAVSTISADGLTIYAGNVTLSGGMGEGTAGIRGGGPSDFQRFMGVAGQIYSVRRRN